MKILGLSPKYVFSGFEDSFFDALIGIDGVELHRHKVESKLFEMYSIARTLHPNKKIWATQKDRHYHASAAAFKIKSKIAARIVDQRQQDSDLIYQIGGLWNPLKHSNRKLPLYLQVDYTTRLSSRSKGEWKRNPGPEADFWFQAETELYTQAEKILATTDNARQSIIDDYGIAESKVVTVGCGISPPYDHIEEHRSANYTAKKFLFVGRGFKGKGLDVLFKAFALIRQTHPDSSLTVIGPTGLDVIPEGVNYLGRITDRHQVREQYFQHSAFIMPSTNEPLGQVFLEAMSCKLPCIGTTMDAMPQIIEHGISGYTIEVGDHKALSEYMLTLLDNDQLLKSMGAEGFKTVNKDWLWPQVAKKIYRQMN